ncbi:MAG: manganese efflux pump MntP family protein [Treponema sp.]|jgi:putative Mn2+ efflux pump MntP|nr:manganese efflux pump MntP family protein [Treponema sp.]
MISLIFIALSLSMDAFAVSISSGICVRGLRPFHALRASFFFGLFQFLMPVAGWYLGGTLLAYIEAYDHWIAFILLAFIGAKMIREAVGIKRKAETPSAERGAAERGAAERGAADICRLRPLFTLSVATSIDALAVGISLNIMGHGIWISSGIIGGITFFVCLAGFILGNRLQQGLKQGIGLGFEKCSEIAGGIVLIGIGCKILAEHLLNSG